MNGRRWKQGGLVAVAAALLWAPWSNPHASAAQPQLVGSGIQFGWHIELDGGQGNFVADGEQWDLEFYQLTPGLGGYLQALSYIGRKPDNFIQVYVFANHVGTSFFVNYYNYKTNLLRVDQFRGEYRLQPMEANPTLIAGYVPQGRAPGYQGQAFHVDSPFAQIQPELGHITHPDLSLDRVYPVQNVVVSPSWSEFWMVGLDVEAQRAYFLIFYSVSEIAWVVDLASGAVDALPLGRAVVFPDQQVQVKRNAVL